MGVFAWADLVDARKGDAERGTADRLVLQGLFLVGDLIALSKGRPIVITPSS